MNNKIQVNPIRGNINGFLKASTFAESVTVIKIQISQDFGWFINDDLVAYLKSIEEDVVSGDLNDIYLESLYADYLLGNNPEAKKYPLLVACLYLTLANSAYQDKKIEVAWSNLVKCTSWISCAGQSLRDPGLPESSPDVLKKAASKGGAARYENNAKRVKHEAISLLNKGRQGEGWGKVNDAIDAILPALKKFVSEKELSLSGDGLKALIKRHLKDDESFKSDFHGALSRRPFDHS